MGFVAVINTDRFGVIPMSCSLGGQNVFYRPNKASVANPLIRQHGPLTIGRDCALIKMQPDYSGVAGIVDTYGDLMTLCWQCAAVNILNSHLSYIGEADSKAQAETIKKLYDNIASGIPAVVQRTGSKAGDGLHLLTQNVGQNFIAGDVLDVLQKSKLLSALRSASQMFRPRKRAAYHGRNCKGRHVHAEQSAHVA